MSTPSRLAVFAGGLVLTFAAAWSLGDSVGPLLDEPAPRVPMHDGGANHDG